MPLRISQTPTSALIVDPEPAAGQQLSDMLNTIGVDNIWHARSIRDALGYCKVTPFDVALIRLELDGEDGEHLVSALRAWPGSVDLILAASPDNQRLWRAAEANLPADAFLQMPLTISVLRNLSTLR